MQGNKEEEEDQIKEECSGFEIGQIGTAFSNINAQFIASYD